MKTPCNSSSSPASRQRARSPNRRVAASVWTWWRPRSSVSAALYTWKRSRAKAPSSRFACRLRSRSAMRSSYAPAKSSMRCRCRQSKAEVTAHLGRDAAAFDYGGQKYRFQHLANFVSLEPSPLPEQDVTIPVVLVRAGEHSTGLVADELVGSREIVVKSVGP